MPWSNWEKYGSWNSRCGSICITTPTTPDRPDASVRAAAFGRKLVLVTTSSTRRRVSSATVPPFRTRDTVARETPLSAARSSRVRAGPSSPDSLLGSFETNGRPPAARVEALSDYAPVVRVSRVGSAVRNAHARIFVQ